MITGYNDNFNRTVAAGFGTATSGQVYTVFSTASQYNVTPGTATILPSAAGDRYGYVERRTSDIDIRGQVALSAIPATNLMTVGFIMKRDVSGNNYYNATMMVAAGGAISLRFSKNVTGVSTITTVATGLTYVANTVYNLRAAIYWSNALQTNVLQSKLWIAGGTEPGGWMVSTTDLSHTQYSAGTLAGIMARDEATVIGAVTAKIQNVVATSYGLPIPSGTLDPMCYDPAIAYPKQTALESLADATDLVMTSFDPFANLAQFFPRVRVSNSNVVLNTAVNTTATWASTEFNVGTGTNLGYDAQGLLLPYGIWLATLEVQLNPAASDFLQINITGGLGPPEYAYTQMRSNALQANLDAQGGSGHVSTLIYSNDPALNVRVTAAYNPNTATPYTVRYAALSAIKISDYF
jgi:hypothetical protein